MALYYRVLIPYDGSDPARRAASEGIRIAADQGAELYGIKVISFIGELISPSDSLWAVIEGDLRKKGTDILDELVEMAKEKGLELKKEIREGDASDEILRYAEEIGADLIVMSVGGRGGMGKYMGRNFKRIMSDAPCPVLIVA